MTGALPDKVTTRTCITCGDATRKIYCRSQCNSCYNRALRQSNPEFAERQRENRRKYEQKYPERIEAHRVRRKEDPAARKRDAATKRNIALRNYGTSVEELERLRAAQGGKCGICHFPLVVARKVHIDHCHQENEVRGLLCSKCNNGLGFFAEDPELLLRAAAYLKLPPMKKLRCEPVT